MATLRDQFLEHHPYAYHTLEKREQHETFRNNAQRDAQKYEQIYHEHYKYAG